MAKPEPTDRLPGAKPQRPQNTSSAEPNAGPRTTHPAPATPGGAATPSSAVGAGTLAVNPEGGDDTPTREAADPTHRAPAPPDAEDDQPRVTHPPSGMAVKTDEAGHPVYPAADPAAYGHPTPDQK